MNEKDTNVAVGAAALLLVVGLVVLVPTKTPDGKVYEQAATSVGELPVVQTSKVSANLLGASKVAALLDGGLAAYTENGDGGLQLLDSWPFRRRPKGLLNCTLPDGGLPQEWRRYPAAMLTGVDCDGCAFVVNAGEAANP